MDKQWNKAKLGDYIEINPKEILKNDLEHCMRIPMTANVRALNLSNCCAIVVYEVLRQKGFESLENISSYF